MFKGFNQKFLRIVYKKYFRRMNDVACGDVMERREVTRSPDTLRPRKIFQSWSKMFQNLMLYTNF